MIIALDNEGLRHLRHRLLVLFATISAFPTDGSDQRRLLQDVHLAQIVLQETSDARARVPILPHLGIKMLRACEAQATALIGGHRNGQCLLT